MRDIAGAGGTQRYLAGDVTEQHEGQEERQCQLWVRREVKAHAALVPM